MICFMCVLMQLIYATIQQLGVSKICSMFLKEVCLTNPAKYSNIWSIEEKNGIYFEIEIFCNNINVYTVY